VFAEGYPARVALAGRSPSSTVAVSALQKGDREGSIDHEEFRRILREGPESVYLVDVRDAGEFNKGSLKGAVSIPVDHLQDRIQALPADKPVVFICGTGARGGEFFCTVQDLRPELKNVYYVDAEMTIGQGGSFTLKKPKQGDRWPGERTSNPSCHRTGESDEIFHSQPFLRALPVVVDSGGCPRGPGGGGRGGG
jgi:rhodanese-related sulfurtransferase